MGMETEHPAPRQLVPGRFQQPAHQMVEITGHLQRICRRLAPTDLLADALLEVDDRAGLIHVLDLAREIPAGERPFFQPSTA